MTTTDKEFYLVKWYNLTFEQAKSLLKYHGYDLGSVIDYIKDNNLNED